jgi:hypothetical protein
MRKLAATLILPLLFVFANGCSESPAPPPPKAASPAPLEKGKKGVPKRRPKLEATTKQDKGVAPFSD